MATVTTVDDGRVRIRSGYLANCNRCDFLSGLTECLCDHEHECVDGTYAPECDVLCHSCVATRDSDPTCRDCGGGR